MPLIEEENTPTHNKRNVLVKKETGRLDNKFVLLIKFEPQRYKA
jgi:hypothetical protein